MKESVQYGGRVQYYWPGAAGDQGHSAELKIWPRNKWENAVPE